MNREKGEVSPNSSKMFQELSPNEATEESDIEEEGMESKERKAWRVWGGRHSLSVEKEACLVRFPCTLIVLSKISYVMCWVKS